VVEMGFFGKKNKKTDDTVTTKSPDQIKGEQLNTELQSIRNEIQERKEQLDSINAKLVIAKKEYEEVISEIMSSKKQVNQAKKDLEEYAEKLDSAKKENSD
tara:strand:- start:536 stop:838 length:303 start_codon:yes stop_codon:yes gene_type:complete